MINWNIFKQNILSFFERNVNSSNTSDITSNVASTIASEYNNVLTVSTIQLGFSPPIDGYTVIGFKEPALQSALNNAFSTSRNAPSVEASAAIFSGTVSAGLISAWTGVTFSNVPIPVGFGVVATNLVLTPGTPQPISFSLQDNDDEKFIDDLITFFSNHLQTVSGQAVGTTPSVPPAPIILPWIGIQ